MLGLLDMCSALGRQPWAGSPQLPNLAVVPPDPPGRARTAGEAKVPERKFLFGPLFTIFLKGFNSQPGKLRAPAPFKATGCTGTTRDA
jgi:hypothetical protein